jgi:hypothetical protein
MSFSRPHLKNPGQPRPSKRFSGNAASQAPRTELLGSICCTGHKGESRGVRRCHSARAEPRHQAHHRCIALLVRACRLGKTKMRNQDGGPVRRDANFLAETRCMPREFADRHVRPVDTVTVKQHTALLPGDAAVTVYSEAVAKGCYNEVFYGTQRYGATMFGKHANFSKAMGDYTKDSSNE